MLCLRSLLFSGAIATGGLAEVRPAHWPSSGALTAWLHYPAPDNLSATPYAEGP